MAATASTDGGSTDDPRFGAAMDVAHDAVSYERFEPEEFTDWAVPEAGQDDNLVEALAWALSHSNYALLRAVKSNRLDDEDGASPQRPRASRTFLFGRSGDDDGGGPAFVHHGSFTNAWDDERVVVETPAPWDTPDSMDDANNIVKSLPWGEDETPAGDGREGAHYSFEERVHQTGVEHEDVWVLDAEYLDDLRDEAGAAGYEWEEGGGDEPSDDERTLSEAAGFLEPAEYDRDSYELVGGDRVVVRYESKQTGDTKTKEGTVVVAGSGDPSFSFERDDGKTNRVETDGDEVGIYSTSRYPFMGLVESVTALAD